MSAGTGGFAIASSASTPPPATSVDMSGFAELKAILRIRPFRRLWAVLGWSSLGDWLGLLATSTFAAAQMTTPAAKGAAFGSVIAVRLLPALVLGPVAGVLADRFDRRYTMVACDLVRFVFFASIPAAALLTENAAIVVTWAAIATFVIETVAMLWVPAKEAAVPNLIPRARLETANQITLATTYGIAPVGAALGFAGLTTIFNNAVGPAYRGVGPTDIALYFNAFTFLATALTVFFGIKEISQGHRTHTATSESAASKSGVFHDFVQGWAFVGRTPMVRGLVLGILGAFAGGGVVVGTAPFYARSLSGGDSSFYILFAMLFIGLAGGIVAGPRMIGALSRRRWFGLSIILASCSVVALAIAWHLAIAVICTLLVGVGAGMAFLSGTTLLGGEVDDEIRGRAFAFVQTGTRVVLMLSISLSSVVVGAGGSPRLNVGLTAIPLSTTRLLLAAAGLFGVVAGITAFRQMDDKPGVPLLADLIGSLRGRPLSAADPLSRRGAFIVFEGGEGAGKSTQVARLARLLQADGRATVVTREPGATMVGARIRDLLLATPAADPDSPAVAPRAEALLYAADRAHHVASVVRPALAAGSVVISDRYVDSSLAYQGAGRTLPVEEVSWLSAWATGGLKPDLVILLDVDPAVGLLRVSGRGAADRLERESLAFHERVRYAFLDLAHADPNRYLVLDATGAPDEVAAAVAERVARLLSPADERASSGRHAAPEGAEGADDAAATVDLLTGPSGAVGGPSGASDTRI